MGKYDHILIDEETEITIQLTHEQQKLVFAMHDAGMSVLNDEGCQHELNIIIAKLKEQMHP